MLFSLLLSSFVHAEEPTKNEETQNNAEASENTDKRLDRGFKIPEAKTNTNVIFKSPGYVERPLRPTTHPKDRALSSDSIENFQRLYINERNLQIKPVAGTEKEAKSEVK